MLVRITARKPRWPCLAVLVPLLLAAAGCGGPSKNHVEGKVLFKDGSPCTHGMVFFEPLDPAIKTTSRGPLEKDGSFSLGTDGPGDGVPEGRFRVRIAPLSMRHAAELLVDKKYWYNASPLEYTVVRGKNEPKFEVERAPGK